jgi:hypothetical protein
MKRQRVLDLFTDADFLRHFCRGFSASSSYRLNPCQRSRQDNEYDRLYEHSSIP